MQNETVLSQANRLFRLGEVRKAISLYEQLLDQPNAGVIQEKVRFNMTLARRRLGLNGDVSYVSCLEYELVSTHFDYVYYKSQLDESASSAVDNEIEHYCKTGWREGLDPNPDFCTSYYLKTNPDVKAAGINPFWHYLMAGKNEGRYGSAKEWLRQDPREAIASLSWESRKLPDIPVVDVNHLNETFIDYDERHAVNSAIKYIAFYLPQFHPFPENDQWWGKGFTEWFNVGKAVPNFTGHYQPHCPIHSGYYDLRVPEVMEEQARLARQYGIYGFSYYFYWFGGKTLMETPLQSMLKNKNVNMPFCLTWANENWTRRWDGQENDILIAQDHSDDDSLAFIRHLIPYFKDSRYIKIKGKPLLIVYRADIIPNIEKMVELWKGCMSENGFAGIYLVCAQSFGIRSPKPYGFDASVEFPPHTVKSPDVSRSVNLLNSSFQGKIYCYESVVHNAVRELEPEYKRFRGAMLAWDNTARKKNDSHIFKNFSINEYYRWLSAITSETLESRVLDDDEKFVFINAWNEWAEGTHLEPDRKHGYGYLYATRAVAEKYSSCPVFSKIPARKKSDNAVILHLHYNELWEEIEKYLENFTTEQFDFYITLTDPSIYKQIITAYPRACVGLVDNRGRDVLPFLHVLKKIQGFEYKAICKIHSKKSAYRTDGGEIRRTLYDALCGSRGTIERIVEAFLADEKLGMLAPRESLIKHNPLNMKYSGRIVEALSDFLQTEFDYSDFPAGSMFWFRQKAMNRLLSLDGTFFGVEAGLADGCTEHGIERMFCSIVRQQGFTVAVIDETVKGLIS